MKNKMRVIRNPVFERKHEDIASEAVAPRLPESPSSCLYLARPASGSCLCQLLVDKYVGGRMPGYDSATQTKPGVTEIYI
jgi:hypothetical protein